MSLREKHKPPVSAPLNTEILDLSDPIDSLVMNYQEAVVSDQLPTGVQQARLIRGVQHKDKEATRSLIQSHKGLVAAVAYPFKDQGVESRDLLATGTKALLIAACLYKESDDSDFSDHAIIAIDSALATAAPDGRRILDDTDQENAKPTEIIFQNMAALHQVIERERKSREALEGFSPLEQKVLRLLPLPSHQQIANAIGGSINSVAVKNAKRRCFVKTGTNNTVGLALEMHARGLHYDVPEPEHPLVEMLTDEELEIGSLLDMEYEEIGRIVNGLSAHQVEHKVSGMQQKTGTQSRHELALVINMFDTGERQSPKTILSRNLRELSCRLGATSLGKAEMELLLDEIPDSQRAAIEPYWLSSDETSWKEIGKKLNIAPDAARNRARRGIQAMKKLHAVRQ